MAVDLLEENDIGGLVVLDSKRTIVGILTERDLIRYAASDSPAFSESVQTLMTKNVIVGAPQDDIDSVAHAMTEKRFRHLPVVEHGKLVGIVTIGDVVKAQRDRFEGEVHNLRLQMIEEEDQK